MHHHKKRTFLLHHNLRCLKELLDEYGTETNFTHTNVTSLKRDLVKELENESEFFSEICYCSFINRVILVNKRLSF